MKIVWSHRNTNCSLCKENIDKKIQRLDDTVRKGDKIRRLHYHPDCYVKHIRDWVEKHPYQRVTSNGGRPSLGLSVDESRQRQRLLANLNSLMAYYFPKNAPPLLNIQGDISSLTADDLKKFQNFTKRRERIVKSLEPLGGLPESHGGKPEATRRRIEHTSFVS